MAPSSSLDACCRRTSPGCQGGAGGSALAPRLCADGAAVRPRAKGGRGDGVEGVRRLPPPLSPPPDPADPEFLASSPSRPQFLSPPLPLAPACFVERKKTRPREEHGLASSPSRPQFLAAATTTHAGSFRRAPAPRNTPTSSARSAPPSPPARFSALGLYRPLATPSPWLGFRAGLRRRVSGGPRCTPWEFPIHHGRRRQGLLHGDMKEVMDLQLLKVLSSPHPLPFPSLPHLVCFPSHAGQQGGTLSSSTSSPRMTPLLHQDRVPKASDQTQLEAKEVRLSDMPPITLDDTNVQTAVKTQKDPEDFTDEDVYELRKEFLIHLLADKSDGCESCISEELRRCLRRYVEMKYCKI